MRRRQSGSYRADLLARVRPEPARSCTDTQSPAVSRRINRAQTLAASPDRKAVSESAEHTQTGRRARCAVHSLAAVRVRVTQ